MPAKAAPFRPRYVAGCATLAAHGPASRRRAGPALLRTGPGPAAGTGTSCLGAHHPQAPAAGRRALGGASRVRQSSLPPVHHAEPVSVARREELTGS